MVDITSAGIRILCHKQSLAEEIDIYPQGQEKGV